MSSRRRLTEARMPESFNAYHQWLGLPADATSPTYYQILGLPEFESDMARIAQAGDRATTRVRGFRPGQHAKEWSRLLDEINAAKSCLLDVEVKREYDRCLRVGKSDKNDPKRVRTGTPAIEVVRSRPAVDLNRFPPGMAPPGVTAPAHEAKPQGAIADMLPQPAVGSTSPAAATPTLTVDSLLPPPAVEQLLPPGAVPMAQPVWQAPIHAAMAVTGADVPMALPLGYASPLSQAAPTAVPLPPRVPLPPGVPTLPVNDPMAPLAAPVPVSVYSAPNAPATDGATGYPGPTLAAPVAVSTTQPVYGVVPVQWPPMLAATSAPPGTAVVLATFPETKPAVAPPAVASALGRRRQQAQRNALMVALAGCLLLATAVVSYANREKLLGLAQTPIAKLPAQPTSIDTSGDVPQHLPRTTEGVLPKKPSALPETRPEPTVAPAPEPEATSMPELRVEPAPSMPQATPELAPDPKPEQKPEPAPPPMPEPMPVPMPTKAELVALGKALTAGKGALAKYEFATADEQIAVAESLAKLPEHQEIVARLKEVAGYVKQFRNAVNEGIKALQVGAEIKVGTSTMVAVVSVTPEKLTIRRAGGNVTFPLDELPAGLTMALADSWLNANDPVNRVVKGAYFAVAEGDVESHREKAKKYWEEAIAAGVDIQPLLPFLTDQYDLDKQDEPAQPEAKPDRTKSSE